ncbi:L-arabinose isomerase, partial [Streptomyces canus]
MDTNATAHPDQEIWFLTGSQGLYGDDVLRQVAKQSRNIAEILGGPGKVPVRIVWKPVLTDADAIRRMCQEASASDTCVGVIVWMHTFS